MEKDDLNPVSKCVVIGGSAGSLKVMLQIAAALDPDLDFPVILVLHRKSDTHSSLEELFNNYSRLPVKEAEDKDLLQPGMIYVAPSGYHLLVERDHYLSLDCSEKVLWSRPSIDVTFQSVAEIFGEQALGILLSGANNDGVMGLQSIKDNGGKIMIQDPFNAEMPVMPLAALDQVQPDYLLTDTLMADVINNF